MREIIISREDAGRRVDKFLMKYLDAAPASFIYRSFRKNNVKLKGKHAKGTEVLAAGDVLQLYFTEDKLAELSSFSASGKADAARAYSTSGAVGTLNIQDAESASAVPAAADKLGVSDARDTTASGISAALQSALSEYCDIVYEDDDVILANKHQGVLSQKAAADDISLNEVLLAYSRQCRKREGAGSNIVSDVGTVRGCSDESSDGSGAPDSCARFTSPDTKGNIRSIGVRSGSSTFVPSVCNRLDRNTSGLVCFARSYGAAKELSAVLRERSMHKYYIAVVWGRVEKHRHLEAWIRKDRKTNQSVILESDAAGAEHIETAFGPVDEEDRARLGISSAYGRLCGREYTVLKVELITGRSHQIRAHLASIGHAIVGDPKYGKAECGNSVSRSSEKYGDLSRNGLHNSRISGTDSSQPCSIMQSAKDVNRQLRKEYGISSQLLHAWEMQMPEELNAPVEHLAGKTFYAELPDNFRSVLCR